MFDLFENTVKLIVGLLLIFCSKDISTQSVESYTNYSFDEFLQKKTIDAREYISTVYKILKYPKVDRELRNQGIVRAVIVNQGDGDVNVSAINDIGGLDDISVETIRFTNESYLLSSDEKYRVEVSIEFYIASSPISKDDADIRVVSYEPISCGPSQHGGVNSMPNISPLPIDILMERLDKPKHD